MKDRSWINSLLTAVVIGAAIIVGSLIIARAVDEGTAFIAARILFAS